MAERGDLRSVATGGGAGACVAASPRQGSPARIYVVCSEVPPNVVGGLGRYAERMMAHLARCDVPVDVFALNAPVRGRPRERHGGLTLHRLAPSRLPRVRRGGVTRALRRGGATDGAAPRGGGAPGAPRSLRLIVRFLSFNLRAAARIVVRERLRVRRASGTASVLAVHDWMGGVAGVLCGLLAGTRVVFHVHSNDLTAGTTWRDRSLVASGIAVIEGLQARLAERIVVPSSTMRAALEARGWPAQRIVVIPHGGDDPQVRALQRRGAAERARERARLRARYLGVAARDGGGRLLVYAGRLSARKGVPTLLEAMALLAARGHDDHRLLLIGHASPNTDEDAVAADMVARLGLADRVVLFRRFLPPAELYAHFDAADACVFPSHYEPFGLAALEALALERPVVLGPGFADELVAAGGHLARRCAGGSAGELADRITEALAAGQHATGRQGEGPGAQRAGGCAARGAPAGGFTWARTAELTLHAYRDACT